MPPDAPIRPAASAGREERSERLRHWRHLLGDEHFQAFLGYAKAKVEDTARAAALDEALPGKERRRALARYHAAREILALVPAEEKTLAALLEKSP